MFTADGFEAGGSVFPCRMESEGIRLEAVKRAEKDDSLILRLVEIRGRHSGGILRFSGFPSKVSETDLLEWERGRSLELRDHTLELELKPFEIKTLRVEF